MKKPVTAVILVLLLTLSALFGVKYFLGDKLIKTREADVPQVPVVVKDPGANWPAITYDYHVIVVGTDPEGIAAAVSSARNGLTTLLVDHRPQLGGLMTLGGLNTIDMNYNQHKKIITRGIFLEFYEKLEGDSFRVDTAQKVFDDLVAKESNIHLKLDTPVLEVKSILVCKFLGYHFVMDHPA